MKNLTILMIAVFLLGCSSKPKQTEPSGTLSPVYLLQHELNERPMPDNSRPLIEDKTSNSSKPMGRTRQ